MEKRLLLVASSGGHLIQLLRLKEAFDFYNPYYVTTIEDSVTSVDDGRTYIIEDCSRDSPLKIIKSTLKLYSIFSDVRPTHLVTTGAAPGLLAVVMARLFGTKTMWIDSIANSEKLSLSGRIASKISTKCFTQWPHLCDEKKNIHYCGAVL